MNSEEIPQFSTMLWSEQVAIAEANAPLPDRDPTYEFSNDRKFREKDGGPYA
jgi:hypothetical protein